jgi:hypothetical protein
MKALWRAKISGVKRAVKEALKLASTFTGIGDEVEVLGPRRERRRAAARKRRTTKMKT